MLSPALSLAYLQLIVLGGTISTISGSITIPTGTRYLSFHESSPLNNSVEVSSRQQISLNIDNQLIVAINTNRIEFTNFNSSTSDMYCSLWTAETGGQILAYTQVHIPTAIINAGLLIIEPQMFVFEPNMCG